MVLVLEPCVGLVEAVVVAPGIDRIFFIAQRKRWFTLFAMATHAISPVLKTARDRTLYSISSCFSSQALEIERCDLVQG